MILNAIFWLAVIYVSVVILWRLIIALMMVIEGYQDQGLSGALMAAAINFFMNLWDLCKFAFSLLIFIFVMYMFQSCSL